MEEHRVIIFYAAIIIYSLILAWGIRQAHLIINKQGGLANILSEKTDDPAKAEGQPTSYSRVSGFVGSMGLASVFIGIGYWVIFMLFADKQITNLENLKAYFLSGSALFAPYAFNKISGMFKGGS